MTGLWEPGEPGLPPHLPAETQAWRAAWRRGRSPLGQALPDAQPSQGPVFLDFGEQLLALSWSSNLIPTSQPLWGADTLSSSVVQGWNLPPVTQLGSHRSWNLKPGRPESWEKHLTDSNVSQFPLFRKRSS